jgi:hypothetical protein
MTVTTLAREGHHRRTTLERTNMIWRDLEAAAPKIARLGEERFDRARVGLLGTLRKDGSPRISPVEPYLTQGHLLFGAMSWSLKRRDVLRDPRCVLHSTISDPDSGEGELKLYGRATEADEQIRNECREGWWATRPAGCRLRLLPQHRPGNVHQLGHRTRPGCNFTIRLNHAESRGSQGLGRRHRPSVTPDVASSSSRRSRWK